MPSKKDKKEDRFRKGDLIFKVIVVGDINVGKTSLVRRFLGLSFEYAKTIGPWSSVAWSPDYVTTLDKTKIFFSIWVSSHRQVERKVFTKGASGALLIFDCSNRKTATNLLKFGDLVTAYADRPISLMVVGNKIDLRNQKPKMMTYEEGKMLVTNLAEKTKFTGNISYVETSAKEDINIRKTFQDLSASIVTLLTRKNMLHDDFYRDFYRRNVRNKEKKQEE
jgi:GTPase SAR1 family protein